MDTIIKSGDGFIMQRKLVFELPHHFHLGELQEIEKFIKIHNKKLNIFWSNGKCYEEFGTIKKYISAGEMRSLRTKAILLSEDIGSKIYINKKLKDMNEMEQLTVFNNALFSLIF